MLLLAGNVASAATSWDKDQTETLRSCADRLASKLAGTDAHAVYWDAANLCETLTAATLRDREQDIRSDNYVFQRGENTVLMWMVVAITLAGVFLAAGQLWASYSLALRGRVNLVGRSTAPDTDASGNAAGALSTGSSVHFSKDELAVQSSVVGVIVLAISFAFFLVFVLYVYTFQEPSEALKQEQSGPAAPHQVYSGQLQPTLPHK